jgi:hypothetical protein
MGALRYFRTRPSYSNKPFHSVEKKRRKKLLLLVSRAFRAPGTQFNKVFLLLFVHKKKCLLPERVIPMPVNITREKLAGGNYGFDPVGQGVQCEGFCHRISPGLRFIGGGFVGIAGDEQNF